MKLSLFFVLGALSFSALADNCTSVGIRKSEDWVRNSVKSVYGNDIKIQASTRASTSNLYTTEILCHYETIYTFSVLDPSGETKKYLGRSIMDNKGLRPMPPTLSEVKTL